MLHYAAMSDCYEIVNLLIERGAKVEEKDKFGKTPLHCAVDNNSIEVGKLLIERGAKVEEKDKFGKTSFQKSQYCGRRVACEKQTAS